jgi:hypothetical protein
LRAPRAEEEELSAASARARAAARDGEAPRRPDHVPQAAGHL